MMPPPCAWCQQKPRRLDNCGRGRFCSQACRQTAWRFRKRGVAESGIWGGTRRIAYADPPYPGCAERYYADEPDYAGEVDHGELLERLAGYDGWALSTSVRALPHVLPLCPAGIRICAWVKPKGADPRTWGLHNVWEAVIVRPARHLRPGVPDALWAHAARGGGSLPGRKPLAFVAWLFRIVGALPGDELVDLFPGTGIVGRAWREASRRAAPGDVA